MLEKLQLDRRCICTTWLRSIHVQIERSQRPQQTSPSDYPANRWIQLKETDCGAESDAAMLKTCHGANKQKRLTFTPILKVHHTSVSSASLRQPLRRAFYTHFLRLAWTLLTQTSQGLTMKALFQVPKFHKVFIIIGNLWVTDCTESLTR